MKTKVFYSSLLVMMLGMTMTVFGQENGGSGRLEGRVIDRVTQAVLPGVNVLLLDTQLGASTDADGRFVIDRIPVGTYRVRFTFIGYGAHIESDVVISTAHPKQLQVALEEEAVGVGGEVEITASYFHAPKEQTTSVYAMNYEEIRRQPGASGDVSRMIQTMPGVVPTNDQRNDLVVRGGSPSENLTLIDNIEVPNISHFGTQGASGGPINMLSSEFIREATFSAGGFPVRYGDRLSSVLDIQLRDGNREGLAGTFDLGIAGAGLIAEGPINAHGSWMFAARKSYLDLIFKSFGLTAIPNYTNYQGKISFDPSPEHRLWLVSLGGIDDIHFEPDQADTEDPEVLDVRSGGWRTTTGANWQWLWGSAGYGTLSISDTWSYFKQNAKDPRLAGAPEVFRNASGEGETILKYDAVRKFDAVELQAGISHRFLRADFDIATGTDDGPFINDSAGIARAPLQRALTTDRSSAYLSITTSPLPRVDLTLGLRWERYGFIGEQAVDPRAALRWQVTDDVTLSASVGRFSQQPALVYLSAVPSNADLLPIRADHYIAGIAWLPLPDLKVSFEAYRKNYSRYPVSTEFPQLSLANDGDSYTINGRLIPFVSEGTGYAEGVEFFVQQKLSDALYGQVSYTISRARHQALDGVERPASFDIPHVLYVIGGYRLNEEWEFSTKFSFASGRPRTPAKLPESADQNRWIYDVANLNSQRIPDYQRLDLRVDNRQHFSGWNLVSYIELQNVLSRRNVFTYLWNQKSRSEEPVYQIGFFVIGGIKIEF
ncbi:MAG: TonB-dependent receptor [Bacteroidetes bacterium]|nr:TonB-dependent receptor [Bacteroidota bacterium]